jgi:hypothetical protein
MKSNSIRHIIITLLKTNDKFKNSCAEDEAQWQSSISSTKNKQMDR